MTTVIELQKLREKMDSNGYAYFDDEAFDKNLSRPCYIPENAEELEDAYTRRDLKKEVENWLQDNEWFEEEHKAEGESHEKFVEDMVHNLYQTIEWEFPSTWLEQRSY